MAFCLSARSTATNFPRIWNRQDNPNPVIKKLNLLSPKSPFWVYVPCNDSSFMGQTCLLNPNKNRLKRVLTALKLSRRLRQKLTESHMIPIAPEAELYDWQLRCSSRLFQHGFMCTFQQEYVLLPAYADQLLCGTSWRNWCSKIIFVSIIFLHLLVVKNVAEQ